jgi:cyclic pyranopterin monophosphate synthase
LVRRNRKFSMADITSKPEVLRQAVASGKIQLKPSTIIKIRNGRIAKGDPIAAAEVAAVLAAKNTPQVLPFCHPIPITNVLTEAKIGRSSITVRSTVRTTARTGVEMEALNAASTYLLTVWDMVKPYEKDARGQYPDTRIVDVRVVTKSKG